MNSDHLHLKGNTPLLLLISSTLGCILCSIYSLETGYTIIFQNLFYLPIILACVFYIRKGFLYSCFLALMYFGLMVGYSSDSSILLQAGTRVIIFIVIAGVVTLLVEAGKKSADNQRLLAEFQSSVISNARVWLMVLDPKGTILLWNTAAEEISGYLSNEVCGKNDIWKLLYPEKEYRRQITQTIARIISDKKYLENFETTICARSGNEKIISWNTKGIADTQWKISQFIAIGVDVTEQKQAEEGIVLKSTHLSILNTIISTANKAEDLSQLLTTVLDETLRLLDFDAGGMYLVDPLTRTARIIHSKNLPPELLAEIQILPIDEKPFDTIFIQNKPLILENYVQLNPDRSLRFGFSSLASIPMISKGVAIGALNIVSKRRHAITTEEKQTLLSICNELGSAIERMKAEEELRLNLDEMTRQEAVLVESEDRLLMAQEIGQVGCWEYALEKGTIWGSSEGLRIFGFSPVAGNFPIDEIEACIPERERIHQALIDLISEDSEYNLEYLIHPADGSPPRMIHSIARLEKDARGNPVRILGVVQNITELKHAEEVLKETNLSLTIEKEKAQRYFDIAGSLLMRLDRFGTVTLINQKGCEILGHSIDEIIGKNWFTSFLPEYLRDTTPRIFNDLMAGNTETGEYYENPILLADGNERIIAWHNTILTDDQGHISGVLCAGNDITDSKRLIIELGEKNEQICAANEELSASEEELQHQYNALVSTEEHLRQTTEYLENLISYANVPIIVWNPAYIITRINHAFENLIGRTADELIGRPLDILFPPAQIEYSMRLIETTRAGVRWETVETMLLHQDGSIRTVLWNSSTIYSQDGSTPVATIAQGQDITLRKRLERENEISIIQIQKNLAQLSILNDKIRNPLTVILIYAETADEGLETNPIAEQVSLIDKMINELDQRWMESENVLTMIRKNYQIQASPYTDQILESLKGIGDGTMDSGEHGSISSKDRNLFVEEIRAELYTILDSIDAFVYVSDLETYELLYLNRLGRSLFGDIAGKTCYQVIQKGQDGPCPFCTNHLLTDEYGPTGVHQNELHNTRNGRWYDCRDRAIRWTDGRLVRLEIATDITEQKQGEQALQESEEQFRKIFLNSPIGMALVTPDFKFYSVNPAWVSMTGYSEEELLSMSFKDITHPEYLGGDIEHLQMLVAGKIPVYQTEKRYIRKDGSILWGLLKVTTILDRQEVLRFYGAQIEDITERKKAEQTLRESEEKHRIFVEETSDPFFSITSEGRYLFANQALADGFGRPIEEIVGKTISDFFPKEEADRRFSALKEVFRTGEKSIVEGPVYSANGTRYYVTSITPIKDADGHVLFAICSSKNITEHKQAEEAMNEANQKIRMLTGITRHDILNQISVVHGLQSLANEATDPGEISDYISRSIEVCRHIEQTIGFTREYEQFGVISSHWERVFPVIESAIHEVTLGKIVVQNQITENLEIYADPIIRKVFSTLIENAHRHGGDISTIQFSSHQEGTSLIITCQDDGGGIPAGEKEMIFNHGYGKNTGIGLFLAREILSITGLTIRECGIPGKGARFEILVPEGKYRFQTTRPGETQ